MEEWKNVEGYEDIYEVSDFGRVRTACGKTTESSLHGTRLWKQRVLKQKTDKNGYKRVSLWKDKSDSTFLVHRLVAIAFLEKPEGKDCINHIDGNPSNNYLENLEWCDHTENLIHAFETGLNKNPDPIILFNTNTGKTIHFRSKSEASQYLGRSKGYISAVLNKGKGEVDEYDVFIKANK